MGKRIVSQRRGRGSPTYKSPSHRFKADVKYLFVEGVMEGKVVDIVDDPGRNVPLAKIILEDGREMYVPAAEGMYVGMTIKIGDHDDASLGNIISVKNVPEGYPIFNIEITPYDGGKLVRTAGSYAVVLSHDATKTTIKLPSKKLKAIHPNARVMIGVAAGGDIDVKPYVKAGNKYYAMKARNKLYPITSKTAMNAVDHKFGGSSFGVPKTVSRHAPPGRKVGSIAARRTGVRKGKL
ncbi:MAG: 50S ribosomal protein L2 [Candidatus Nanohaloarchaeota archaeon]|nr:50S ribosomal protein L2 [Candidatus Nanohaloarchaeota archaeon]